MTFETCAAEVCWEIHIVANERVENTKYFILHLEKVEENDFITIEAPEKLFTIFDNSSK